MSALQPSTWKSLPGPEDILRVALENGITVLARANFASPSVVLSGYLPAGSMFEPQELLGLAHFTALALMRGSARHSFQEIFDLLESAGASLGFGASAHNTSFGGRALAEDLPLLLSILAETMRTPAFPQKHIERLRGQILTGLSIRDQDTADRAELAFEALVFPDHPYGRPTDGHPATIQRIARDDIAAYHSRYYGPAGMKLAVVGAIEPQKAVELVQAALGDWINPNQPTLAPLAAPAPDARGERQHIALPGKVQCDLILGCLGPRRADPEFLAASLGNNILGQFGMMGRIGEVVREKSGLAYHAGSSLNAWIDAGSWEISAGVNPANLERAIELILSEVARFTSETVAAEELSDSQAHYIGRLPLSLESNSGVANALLNLERFNLGLDYYRRYPAQVEAVTAADILAAARKWLDPNRFVIVSAGPEI
jgi:zinc protease